MRRAVWDLPKAGILASKICWKGTCQSFNLVQKYELTKDWSGDLYCGIKLKWDYAAQTAVFSMPCYIKKVWNASIACQQNPNIALILCTIQRKGPSPPPH